MTDQNKTVARRVLEEGFSQGRIEVVDAILAPDHINHDPTMPANARGPEPLKQQISMYRAAFPDLTFTIEEQMSDGDRVMTRWSSTGTHRGPLMGAPPTGKRVVVTGITINRVLNGKIVESWANWDAAGLYTQLGISAAAQGSQPRQGDGGRPAAPLR